ncbi:MAG: hypothetical protein ACW981_12825 [Candidatus Hodarchaeales archaeon]|jgi:hypothetical protein
MTSYDKKLKKSYAGEDIAGIFQEEEAGKEKSFKRQKSKNSELLANFRAKMSEIRTTDNEMGVGNKNDLELSFNSEDENKMGFEKKYTENTRHNSKRKFSIKRPFFSKNKSNNQQRRKKPNSNPEFRHNKRY